MRTCFGVPAIIVVLAACGGQEGPAGPRLSGDLSGRVLSYDQYGFALANGGVTVSVDSATVTATSDSSGGFTLQGLPTGTYTLSFARTGFGTTRLVGLQFVGGGALYLPTPFRIGQLPTFTLILDSLTMTNSTGEIIYLWTTLSTPPPSGGVAGEAFFFGRTPSVSSTPGTYLCSLLGGLTSPKGFVSFYVNSALIVGCGFTSGQTVYIAAYPSAVNPSTFNDPQHSNASVSASLGALSPLSRVLAFTLP